MRRTDPAGQTRCFFRSEERVFALNGEWFFASRDGECGPYLSREHAAIEVVRYVRGLHDLDHLQQSTKPNKRRTGRAAKHNWEILPLDESFELEAAMVSKR